MRRNCHIRDWKLAEYSFGAARRTASRLLYNAANVKALTASYSHFREHLAEVWDQGENSQEPVIVSHRGHQDMAILPADELESLRETAHPMRSPKDAPRLLEAIVRAMNGEGERVDPRSLRIELNLTD